MIDFKKLTINTKEAQVLSPRDIFGTLTEKNQKYEYPRDVQSEVMDSWFNNRNNRDSIIKMNTGSGKTVVGLLILKSCLAENKGPAVYVAPDSYLVQQVIDEAQNLGIEVTEDISSSRFLKGKAILIINIHKLINGFSKFGVNEKKIEIGSIIIDDAHASIDYTEEQFTFKISKNIDAYSKLYKLFENDLKQQCEMKVLELAEENYNTYMQVPFWTWKENAQKINEILFTIRENDEIKFKWPLIKNHLSLCNCIIGSHDIEISPKFLPIDIIPSFHYAKRRIFMTATLSDDTILATHFGVNMSELENIITPLKSNDIGERMILAPQELNPNITDSEIKDYLFELSKIYNIVVIVSSNYRYKFWEDIAAQKLTSTNLYDGISKLKSSHVGLSVLVNKYDGIDLPKDACHILVIDDLPDVRRKIDKVKESALQGNENIQSQLIHKIEQGMGRGVRSRNDYCVIILLGKRLIGSLYANNSFEKFSNATKLQMEISEQLSEQIRGKTLNELTKIINYCLKRNQEWMQASRNSLIDVEYEKVPQIKEEIVKELEAFNYFKMQNSDSAIKTLRELISSIENKFEKGWLMQELAFYVNDTDPINAQEILKSAQIHNSQLLKPITGIQYSKIITKDFNQGMQLLGFINNKSLDSNKFILKVDSILNDLNFEENSSNRFEQAFKDLADVLGFKSQRPENEFNKGPDVLWSIGELEFLVIECKNEATSEYICKHDCNQLNGSREWFLTNYDRINCICYPIMIHPSTTFEYACSPNKDILIMDYEMLNKFKKNISEFSRAISKPENFNNIVNIAKYLDHYGLTKNKIITTYFKKFRSKK